MPFDGLRDTKLREVTTRKLNKDRISQGCMPVIPRGKNTWYQYTVLRRRKKETHKTRMETKVQVSYLKEVLPILLCHSEKKSKVMIYLNFEQAQNKDKVLACFVSAPDGLFCSFFLL